jgi:hypothetical protein
MIKAAHNIPIINLCTVLFPLYQPTLHSNQRFLATNDQGGAQYTHHQSLHGACSLCLVALSFVALKANAVEMSASNHELCRKRKAIEMPASNHELCRKRNAIEMPASNHELCRKGNAIEMPASNHGLCRNPDDVRLLLG